MTAVTSRDLTSVPVVLLDLDGTVVESAPGILAALESSHAIAQAIKLARELPQDALVLANLSGRGDKDVEQIARGLTEQGWGDRIGWHLSV